MGKSEIKERINVSKSKNFCFVTVRSDHCCKHCGTTIKKGTSCLTINKKKEGRAWLCEDCLSLLVNILDAKADLDSVSFSDEGAAMACIDTVESLLGEYECRGIE